MEDTLLVFTSQTIERMARFGGSTAWAVDAHRVRRCRYSVCTWNDFGDVAEGAAGYAHRTAFLVAPIASVDLSSDPEESGRYDIRFAEFSRIDIAETWPKMRNPVTYTTLERLGIDAADLAFEPLDESAGTRRVRTSVGPQVAPSIAGADVSDANVKTPDVIARDRQRREASAFLIARLALEHEAELHPSHFNEILSLACWKFTEAGGSKYGTRYITRAAMTSDAKQQHEHVIPRLELRSAMHANPSRAEAILNLAIACVVTRDEHRLLHRVAFGWHRYRDLGIDVIDTKTGEPADVAALARDLDAAWRSLVTA